MKNGPNHTPTEVPHLLRRARGQLSKLLGTYWFIPSLMCLAVIGMASAITYVDTNLHSSFDIPWIYINSPEGARSVLSTIAGSVITVAGVAFSITIVALTVTSTQHGPHVVSNLMRDRGNQVVLGTLTATFLYCLLILRTVHSGSDEFPLALSIVAAVLLALASIAMLIYFVHHISNSLRVESLIERVTVDYHDSLERLYPEVIGKEAAKAVEENSELPPSMDESTPLYVQKKGYLQELRPEEIMDILVEYDAVLSLERQPGDFLIPGETFGRVVLRERNKLRDLEQDINGVIAVGRGRNAIQDLRYPAAQLLDVSMRALSPGVCDLLTAILCIDEMGAALSALVEREYPSPFRADKDGVIRLIARPIEFADLLQLTLGNLIPNVPPEQFMVGLRIMELLGTLSEKVTSKKDFDLIRSLADELYTQFSAGLNSDLQKTRLFQCYSNVLKSYGRELFSSQPMYSSTQA